MSIPDAIVEEVRSRADLVEIVAEQTPLKRSGRTFRGPCPLHGGEGPNFSVDPAKNVYKCFVCGEGGDLFSFPMKRFGMNFTEAVRWVADRVGVVIPETEKRRPEEDPNSELYEANAFASEWFRGRLLDPQEGREAREYLSGRGIDGAVCERFGIGWAPERWSGLVDAAAAHGIRQDVLLELGLIKSRSQTGREPYDAFRGRVIFPIEALSARVVAFGGRILGEVEEHIPKYLNSPESRIYHKGELLYGLRASRGAIRREESALVVEGYMDFVSLVAHGLENVVAPLGTAMTHQQAELLARYTRRVILLFDSDTAGLKATFRAADELLRAGVEVLVATLPDGEDPDSLVRKGGAAALKRYLHDAVDVLERKIQILERKAYFSSIAGKRRAVDRLLETVRATGDEVLRGIYIARIAERTGVPAETIEREVTAGARADRRPAPRSKESGGERAPDREAPFRATQLGAERNLLILLLRDEQWIERAAERLGPEDFHDPTYREIFAELLNLHAEGQSREGGDWLLALSSPVSERAQELLGDPEGWNLLHPNRFFEENLRDIEARNQRARLAEIDREVEGADGPRQAELLREKRELRQAMERSGVVLNVNPTRRPQSGRDG
jgi:DNA primase